MNDLVLYMTTGCHLCDEAQRLVVATLGKPVPEVDIVDDDRLMTRYGVRIPVLCRADGAELGWPFDAAAVRTLALSA